MSADGPRSAVARALLIGDAAGLVSPLTGGGIHMALEQWGRAGHVVANFLEGLGWGGTWVLGAEDVSEIQG